VALVPAPARHLALVAFAYVVCIGAAWAVVRLAPGVLGLGALGGGSVLGVGVATVLATIVMFGFSRAFDNSSFYDAYWSIYPMTLAPWLASGPAADGDALRHVVVSAAVWIWGARLTWNWIRSWEGLGHEDWRYTVFRKRYGAAYWPFSFAAIHLFPTLCTYLSSWPLFPAMRSRAPFGLLDAIAAAVAIGGAIIEATSDRTLRRYREECQRQGVAGAICEVGLWRYSRHPNYFGECMFWVGVWLMGVAADSRDWHWTLAGPAVIVSLFVFGTIPMMEKRSLERRPEFAAHQRKVSMLVPWFRRDRG
jgi:steroid 5-alpha reductase family enzyme